MIEVRYEHGVYLPKQDIWLDSWEAKDFGFVSHAHGDHIAPHKEIIVSQRTARLMRVRLPGSRIEHALPFGEKTLRSRYRPDVDTCRAYIWFSAVPDFR